MGRLQYLLAFACFTSSLFIRMTDPLVPVLARDLATTPDRIALLTTAFALPFGLLQLVLGPIGDRVGRTGVIRVCMALVCLTGLMSAFVWSVDALFALRVIAGAASAGIFPATIALTGDRIPMEQRQAVLSKMLGATITGGLIGAVGAGALVEAIGWRGVFLVYTGIAVISLALLLVALPGEPKVERPAGGSVIGGFRTVLRNPRAKVCFTAVFFEGLTIFGLFPFVAVLLEARGDGGALIAGLVIAGFPLGGILYAMAAPWLVATLRPSGMMATGGIIAGAALTVISLGMPWQAQGIAFVALGLGLYMLHNSLQVQTTELSPAHRGSAVAMHGCSFMGGQALGPIVYGPALAAVGPVGALTAAGLIVAATGLAAASLLRPGRNVAAAGPGLSGPK